MQILKKQTTIDFLGKRKLALILSVSLVLISVGSFVTRGLNPGIDFAGGTLVEVGYQQSVDVESVRVTLVENGFDDAIVQNFGTTRDVMVRLPATFSRQDTSAAEISSRIMEALRVPWNEVLVESAVRDSQQCLSDGVMADCQLQMRRVEFVGPQVGSELTNQGRAGDDVCLAGHTDLCDLAIRMEICGGFGDCPGP